MFSLLELFICGGHTRRKHRRVPGKGVKAMIEEARKIVGDGPCYLTIDVDALDPKQMPGIGLPEPLCDTDKCYKILSHNTFTQLLSNSECPKAL